MTPELIKFILELLVCKQERILLRALLDDPKDPVIRAAYGDWLEENERGEAASMIRKGWDPLETKRQVIGTLAGYPIVYSSGSITHNL